MNSTDTHEPTPPKGVALVTGAGRGIGRAIARRLCRDGYYVVIADIDEGSAVRAAEDHPDRSTGVGCDVTNREEVERLIANAARLGRLELVVHNVGVSREVQFEDMTDDDWRFQTEGTLSSAFLVSQAALAAFGGDGGCIVFIGSVNGMAAFGHEAYSAAKAGLASLAQNLTLRFGPAGVRTNVVAPGSIHTEFWDTLDNSEVLLERVSRHYPLGRIGHPDDIAGAVSFLASEDASWISGIVLPVDGGLLAGNLGFTLDRDTHPTASA